jgi:hypothetical protein
MALNQPEKLGVDNLRDALTAMLNTQIAQSIPSLIPEIRIKIADCKSELDQLGHARITRSQQLNCMMNLATEFSRLSTMRSMATTTHYRPLTMPKFARYITTRLMNSSEI